MSLKGRLELGMSWPLRLKALDAASGLAKSTKQYPALLLHKLVCVTTQPHQFLHLPGEFVADHLDIDGLAHVVPDAAHEVLVDPGLELTHPVPC